MLAVGAVDFIEQMPSFCRSAPLEVWRNDFSDHLNDVAFHRLAHV